MDIVKIGLIIYVIFGLINAITLYGITKSGMDCAKTGDINCASDSIADLVMFVVNFMIWPLIWAAKVQDWPIIGGILSIGLVIYGAYRLKGMS